MQKTSGEEISAGLFRSDKSVVKRERQTLLNTL